MGKRSIQPVMVEEPDFPEIASIGSSFELPTADEFVCSGDEVREECQMLEGAHESYSD
ncbi:MAG: hypothetical protein JWN94_4483 [Betaproteobacteria bacterium]|nr:hypothetical protein [Betaproteobacteria bacterium]